MRSPERPSIDLSKRDRFSNSVMAQNKGNISHRETNENRGLLPSVPSLNQKSVAQLQSIHDGIDPQISKKLFGSITV